MSSRKDINVSGNFNTSPDNKITRDALINEEFNKVSRWAEKVEMLRTVLEKTVDREKQL